MLTGLSCDMSISLNRLYCTALNLKYDFAMPSSKTDKKDINNLMMEEFRQGMNDFNSAMQAREELSLRIGKRTTQIIRYTLFGLSILGLAMFFLIWTLTSNMNNITDHMETMAGDIKSMRGDFQQVSSNLSSMKGDFSSVTKDLGAITHSVNFMQIDTSKLNKNIGGMGTDITTLRKILAQMDKSVHHMGVNVTGMNQGVERLSMSVGAMSENISYMTDDIDKMVAPMRLMPFTSRNKRRRR